MYLEVFGHGVLVLNSHAAAVDLLDRRGVNYGDRPAFISAQFIFLVAKVYSNSL